MPATSLPLNPTPVMPVKLIPSIVTNVPGTPTLGKKLVMTGAIVTTKFVALVAVPPEVVTVIFPVLAVAGTWALIRVEEATPAVGSATLLNRTVAPVAKLTP